MEVNIALHMRVGDGVRQHREGRGFRDGAGEQIALRGIDVGVLVCVLAHQRFVAVDQTAHRFVDIGGLGTLDVFVQAVVRVGARHLVQMVLDERVLHQVLDVFDLRRAVVAFADLAFDLVRDVEDHALLLRTDLLVEIGERRLHGNHDIDRIEVDHAAIALLNQHPVSEHALEHIVAITNNGPAQCVTQNLSLHRYLQNAFAHVL